MTGVRADWLLFGTEPMMRSEPEEVGEHAGSPPQQRRHFMTRNGQVEYLADIPVLSRVPAGEGVAYTDGDLPAGEGLGGMVTAPDPQDENAFALVIEGDSMAPDLMPGDIVVVSPRRKDDLRFPIAVARIAGNAMVKFVQQRGSAVVLRSRNEAYPDIELPASEVQIIGRVIHWSRSVKG